MDQCVTVERELEKVLQKFSGYGQLCERSLEELIVRGRAAAGDPPDRDWCGKAQSPKHTVNMRHSACKITAAEAAPCLWMVWEGC
uniref:Uncharacterized protein n=1 Tax=Gallus gallus TaxID=9031 RepID=A0A1L1RUU1_CHICK